MGIKLSKVVFDNIFFFFDVNDGVLVCNDNFFNCFEYDENVYVGYLNFVCQFGEKWNVLVGVCVEQIDVMGDL